MASIRGSKLGLRPRSTTCDEERRTWILGSIFLPATSDYSVRLLPERVPGMVEGKSLEHGESTAFWALGGAGAACSAVQGKTFRRERGGEGCDRAGFCLLVDSWAREHREGA
jgi:hypothetical protein